MTASTLAPQLAPGENSAKHVNAALRALRHVPGGFTVATVPAPSDGLGVIVSVIDGDAGKPCLAMSDGTSWHRIAFGPAVSSEAAA